MLHGCKHHLSGQFSALLHMALTPACICTHLEHIGVGALLRWRGERYELLGKPVYGGEHGVDRHALPLHELSVPEWILLHVAQQ